MKKSCKILLYRETLRQLATPNTLREAGGAVSATGGCAFCFPSRGFTMCPGCSQ